MSIERQTNRRPQQVKTMRVWHYLLMLMLAMVISLPAAILSSATPVEASPLPPTLVSPANGYATNITTVYLDWNAPAGAVSYDVWVDNRSDFHNNNINSIVFHQPGRATEVTTPPLPDGKYYWKVGAYGTYGGSTGWSAWSSVRNFTVDTVAPGVPTQVSVGSAITDTTPTLDWNTVTGAVSYEWQISTDDWLRVPYSSGTTTSSSYTFTSPLTFSRYFWQVRAIDAAGNIGAWSLGDRFYLLGPPQFTQPADGSIFNSPFLEFDWKYVYGVSYEFQMDDSSDFSSPLLWIETPFPYYLPEWRVDGTYYCRVRGLASGVTGLWSPVLQITVDTAAPGAPVLASPANGSVAANSTPTLSWNAVSHTTPVSYYEWQIANNAGFSPLYSSGTTTATSYTFPSALPQDIYYWRIRAKDTTGHTGGWSTAWWILVGPLQTTLTVSPANTSFSGSVNLSATLKTANGNTPLSSFGPYDIAFTVNSNSVGTARTDTNGVATLNDISTAGIPAGTYPTGIGATFVGNSAYGASSGTAQLSILAHVNPVTDPWDSSVQPGLAATGGGWYTLSDNGRVNFSFTVNQVPKTSDPIQYKGELTMINEGKWRLKGVLTKYVTFTDYPSQARAGGDGQLYLWDSALEKGQGGWSLVGNEVSFSICFTDEGAGQGAVDTFGIDIAYTIFYGLPPLPNSEPVEIKGGNIDMKDINGHS